MMMMTMVVMEVEVMVMMLIARPLPEELAMVSKESTRMFSGAVANETVPANETAHEAVVQLDEVQDEEDHGHGHIHGPYVPLVTVRRVVAHLWYSYDLI